MVQKESSREGAVPPPKCKAILLCERVIIEKDTEQLSLVGLINVMVVDSPPAQLTISGSFSC